ncbi:MAG: PrsW family intramembrane metalloprotease [Ruminococcus sp.]|nr:PrsW family intramembrane metalloprotease [Ruminococcus sp.]
MLLALSLLPAILLIVYIYRKDKIEREPVRMLVKLFLWGAVTVVSAAIIECLLCMIVGAFLSETSIVYIAIENFLIVALAEETGKYIVLKKKTWHSPEFNYTFDAVVYAVAVSLGFAALENIIYVTSGTLGTAILRGLTAVPGHAVNGVYMGCYYGIARKCRAVGDEGSVSTNLRKALWVPVLIHGFYDFCLSLDSVLFILVFLVFEVVITIMAVRKVNKLSREDEEIFDYV